jgi:hypothetical protein
MAEGFARTWRRPPTREEIEGLIKDRVQEEVYCREAMALGLDKDDTVIRRRCGKRWNSSAMIPPPSRTRRTSS